MFSPRYLLALPFLFAASIPAIAAETKTPPLATVPAKKALTALPESGLPATWIQGTPVTRWEKDKVYVFEFWATWCGPCLAAIPHLESIHQKITREKLPAQVIGVNVRDKTSPEKLKPFLDRRNTPPTYTIAADTTQSAETQWLKPLKIIGIPFAAIVKNGKILWKGHPTRLSVEMVRAMTRPDYVPQAPGKDPAQIKREADERLRKIGTLFSTGKLAEAEDALQQFVGDAAFPTDSKISALEIPCYRALNTKEFPKLNACLRRQAEAFPRDFRNQLRVANFILTTDDIPEDYRDLALALECLQRADELSKDQHGQRSSVQSRMAEIYDIRGETEAARTARKTAWELSHEYAYQQRLRKRLSENEKHAEALALLNALAAGKGEIPADFYQTEKRKETPTPSVTTVKLTPSDSDESAKTLELLRSLEWVQGSCPKTLPKNGVVFIDFWMPPSPGPYNRLTMRLPAAWLNEKTKSIAAPASTYVIALERTPGRTREALGLPRYATPHAVASVPAPDGLNSPTLNALLKHFKITEFPASLALRDGKIIWVGNAQNLPEWITREAVLPDYDHALAEAKRAEQQKEFSETLKVISEARKLSRDARFDEARKLVESIRPILDRQPTLDMLTTEILMTEHYTKKDFAEIGRISEAMLNKHPNNRHVAELQIKLLNSNVDLHAATLPVLIHACKNIVFAGTPYESAYWEIISQYYEEAGMMKEAVYAAIMAQKTAEKYKALQEK